MERPLLAAVQGPVKESAVSKFNRRLPIRPMLAPEVVGQQLDARRSIFGVKERVENTLVAMPRIRAASIEFRGTAAFGPCDSAGISKAPPFTIIVSLMSIP